MKKNSFLYYEEFYEHEYFEYFSQFINIEHMYCSSYPDFSLILETVNQVVTQKGTVFPLRVEKEDRYFVSKGEVFFQEGG